VLAAQSREPDAGQKGRLVQSQRRPPTTRILTNAFDKKVENHVPATMADALEH